MSVEGQPHLTVVIPTFNRSTAVAGTVESVLRSDVGDGVQVEVIVVDDGSAEPASNALVGLRPPAGWSLRVARQDNRGVGAARNRGYREAAGDIVVFVDDDMLLFPETLRRHLEAHRCLPGSVIFGRSPYVPQPEANPFVEWVLDLTSTSSGRAEHHLIPATIIASGHLSVERGGPTSQWSELYADDMRTPVAEEYELSHRLQAHGVPVYRAPNIVAFHNRTIDVESFMRQQLGHGKGCAEAARLHPECLALEQLRHIIDHHQRRSAQRAAWVALGSPIMRSMLRRAARVGERGQLGPLAPLAFRLSAGAWFAAGVRS